MANLSRDLEYALFEGHTKGLSDSELAEGTGLDVELVSQWRRDERLPDCETVREVMERVAARITPTRLPRLSDVEYEEGSDAAVARLHAQGMTIAEIARRLNWGYGKVRTSFKRQGLKSCYAWGKQKRKKS